MNVNINAITSTVSRKLDMLKQSSGKEEFKKILHNNELRSKDYSNENVHEKYHKDDNMDKTNSSKLIKDVEENTEKPIKDVEENTEKLSKDVEEIIEKSLKELEDTDKFTEDVEAVQQLIQLLSSILLNPNEASVSNNGESELNVIKLEQLISGEKLSPDTKQILKNNLSEIVALLEKSKGSKEIPSQIIDVLQKLSTEVGVTKNDLRLLKVSNFQTVTGNNDDQSIKDNLLKKVIDQGTEVDSKALPKSQMQSSNNDSKDNKFSGNSSSEEKFLNNLLGTDKDEMKISKAVSFMNQFDTVKTLDTSKVQTPNLVIDKNSFAVDVIKTVKFMELNNIKDLTVKMNPKELGEITIKLTMESGIIKANISAQNKDTYNLLNHNIQDISDKLKSMDIKIQSLDINIYEDSTFFSKDSNERNNNGRQSNNSKTNMVLGEEDILIRDNYAIEESVVNKFV